MARSDHYFIYPRNSKREYTGNTVCVMVREGLVFHGEAICSHLDQFERSVGRSIALARALESYEKYKARKSQKV